MTQKEQEEIRRLERVVMEATIEARKKCNLTQNDMSRKTGITQPIISRIENGVHSPQIHTLLKLLYTMGYALQVVPIEKVKKKK